MDRNIKSEWNKMVQDESVTEHKKNVLIKDMKDWMGKEITKEEVIIEEEPKTTFIQRLKILLKWD